MPTGDVRPYAFILSWERPIFLWACLDALYRHTRVPVRFVLVDNHSRDPLVRDVIRGFERRGMFDRIIHGDENDPHRVQRTLDEFDDLMGPYFYFIESDVVVPPEPCWASEYERIYQAYPRTAMVGSFCDKADFVPPEVIRGQAPDLSDDEVEFYAKSRSPERTVAPEHEPEVWPHAQPNPPGRLTLLDTEAIRRTGMRPDRLLAKALAADGYESRICTTFVHRHLSLLNWYDTSHEGYAQQRAQYFRTMAKRPGSDR